MKNKDKAVKIDIQSGLLDGVEFTPSDNFDERPNSDQNNHPNPTAEQADISLIVVHNISLPPGEFGGPYISQLFTNCLNPEDHPYFKDIYQLTVSSHILIRRDGEIIQYVPFHKRAWHAGISHYAGRDTCNDFSIGIELEGADDIPYETLQYETLANLILALQQSYPELPKDAITGHCDIAPERKTDPGPAFDWTHLHALLANTPIKV